MFYSPVLWSILISHVLVRYKNEKQKNVTKFQNPITIFF
jgi:hypothetical protein